MDVGKDKIKDLFSSKLGSFEPEVPASVWGGLDQLLSVESTPTVDTSTSTASSSAGNSSLLKLVIVVVGLTAAIVTGIFLLNDDETIIVSEESISNEYIIKTDTVETLQRDSVFTEFVSESYQPVKKIVDAVPISEEVAEEIEKETPIVESKQEDTQKNNKKEDTVKVWAEDEVRVIPLREEDRGRRLSIGLVSNIGLSPYSQTDVGGYMLLSNRIRSREFLETLDKEKAEFELKHSRPLSLGITIEKYLDSNFSLETGIVYTYLSSELASSGKYNIRETQTFSYIGVPLSLNYTFYKMGAAKFYLSIGGMLQKDINGKYISNLNLPKPNGENGFDENLFYGEPYYVKKYLKQTNPQFSVRSKLGVVYPLYKKLYIYGAIGGVYYFDANNEYRTIYSDKKTQLDLDLGVKYEF